MDDFLRNTRFFPDRHPPSYQPPPAGLNISEQPVSPLGVGSIHNLLRHNIMITRMDAACFYW